MLTFKKRVPCGQWLKYKIGGGGSLLISGPLRDPADIFRCIVDANWASDLSTVKFLGPGSQIWQDPAYFNHCCYSLSTLEVKVELARSNHAVAAIVTNTDYGSDGRRIHLPITF